ncbi:hypothetical protein [Sediminibacillus massiliensis]|uniref:hypothetical protein n=1 Tax=Sediminibacillus massiliensis TaxID=1926277 RepID=UPI00098845B8|nr:hypothetical protein [Sediminibacillus massiliensis]
MDKKIITIIDAAIKHVWNKDLSRDYDNSFLLKEDSLKSAFYFHLRNRLGEAFLHNHNLRLFTEYFIGGQRIDLVIAEIDPEKTGENFLGDCVTKVITTIEMKYKGSYANEVVFYEDISKVLAFTENWQSSSKHYLAFIQEKYFRPAEVVNWLDDKQSKAAKDKVTELHAYWNGESDETVWNVFDY